MPKAWIEKCESQRVQKWAYDLYCKSTVLYATDRQKFGHPAVAEIPVTDDDIKRFSPVLDKAVTIIIYHRDFIHKPIDAEAKYPMEDIIFDVKFVD